MVTEASTRISYWEGSIVVRGENKDAPVTEYGRLELTGYSGQSLALLFASDDTSE